MITVCIITLLLLPALMRIAFLFGVRKGREHLVRDRAKAFDQGHTAGHARGELEGYKKGFAEGEKIGLKKGRDEGFADGHRYGASQRYNEEALRAMGLHFTNDERINAKR